ncbi:hypothetical protein SUGI_0112370 [Cryptomeria japonica]|uniref:RING-H2 finger protein ATL2-like n=1 Tax=Cryptomeria japonica TaxID=3369 RepID=UPI002408A71F|nr:RING-H2 finger protein ATL2-like [Cryptomeria japonica]GLJ09584.1 hypothetical protein SUGI_0112370 [Cryptomeria japonica]
MASHRENGGESKNEEFMDNMMLGLCVGLFTAVLLMAVITILAILYNRRRRRFPIQFFSNRDGDPIRLQVFPLEKSVVESFLVFVYPWENFKDAGLECAVCLREFEENEKGRVLPVCKHSFHVDCIDAWFQSYSTCPLCRTRPTIPHEK